MKKFLLSLLCMVFSFCFIHAVEASYTITFTTGDQTQGGYSAPITNLISEGTDYVSSVGTNTKVIIKTEGGVSIGSNSAAGKLVLNLSDAGKVKATKYVVKAYGKSNGYTLDINSIGTKSMTKTSAEYTFTPASPIEISNITIDTSKKSYIQSITVYYEQEQPEEPTLGELIVMADGKKVEDIGEATIELGKSITMTADNATTFEVMCNNPEFYEELEGPTATWTPAGICENSDVEITPYMNGVPGEKFVFSLTVIAPKQQVDKFEWSTPSVTLMQGDEFTAPTFTCEPAELDVVFSSSNPDVATVGPDGTIELGGAIGIAEITASLTDHDTYSDATAVCTITVTRPGIKVPLHTGIWQRIDNVDQLKDGEIYTIVGSKDAGDFTMSKAIGANNIPANKITITNGLFTSDENTALVVLVKERNNYALFISNAETPGYLYCKSTGSKNYCTIAEEMKGDASLATISIDETAENQGSATIKFITSTNDAGIDRTYLRFNDSSTLFSCYQSSSVKPVYIYGVHTPAPEVDDFTPIDDNTHSVSLLAMEGAEIWYRISPVMTGNQEENAARAREAASREYINSGSNSVTQTITKDQQIDYYAVLHGRESQRMAHSKRNGTTGINSPVVNEISLGGSDEWFDLQGRRVASPSKGNLYILKNGSKVSKRVF